MNDHNTISVGIGELYATRDPSAVLAAYGLGSCVGVSVFDPVARVGGLAHIMLPSSKDATQQTSGYKFADIAIPALLQRLLELGSMPRSLVCKIAGGAQILMAPDHMNSFRIGERNIEAVMNALQQYNIVPKAMDTGGSHGRTLRLLMGTGQVLVRTVGGDITEL
ncbi:MAG: chemotaxis protein CheD [Chloroflexi bacterium]|nr:chemotaxis protein CheD [Chloroflexota bacterium]